MNFELFGVPPKFGKLKMLRYCSNLVCLLLILHNIPGFGPNHGLTLSIQSLSIRDWDEAGNVVKNKHTKF